MKDFGSCPRCALSLRTPKSLDAVEREAVLGDVPALMVYDVTCARCGMILARSPVMAS